MTPVWSWLSREKNCAKQENVVMELPSSKLLYKPGLTILEL